MKDINDLLEEIKITDYKSITDFDCSYEKLTSMNGIEKLVNLQYLDCFNNQLTSIDLSNNINLERLCCYNNQLKSLDLSNNINLERLSCYNNQLTNLDVSKNINLKILYCKNNKLNIQDLYQQITNNKTIKIINYKNRREFLSKLKYEIISSYKPF